MRNVDYRLVNNCVLPENLVYDVEEDLWAEPGDDGVTIGMTDHSQTIAGNIMHVNFRVDPGDRVDAGDSLATIEAAKWIGVVKAPFTGTVTDTNDSIVDDAELVNRSPYHRGWVVEMESETEDALDGFVAVGEAQERYREKMDRMGLDDCVHCEEFEI